MYMASGTGNLEDDSEVSAGGAYSTSDMSLKSFYYTGKTSTHMHMRNESYFT